MPLPAAALPTTLRAFTEEAPSAAFELTAASRAALRDGEGPLMDVVAVCARDLQLLDAIIVEGAVAASCVPPAALLVALSKELGREEGFLRVVHSVALAADQAAW